VVPWLDYTEGLSLQRLQNQHQKDEILSARIPGLINHSKLRVTEILQRVEKEEPIPYMEQTGSQIVRLGSRSCIKHLVTVKTRILLCNTCNK
jgi:hypothetical protein